MSAEAKAVGLAVVMWSYPRGGKLDKAGGTALDVCAYAAHMAALLGAHQRSKPPTNVLWQPGRGPPPREGTGRHLDARRAHQHVMQATFNAARIVVFSAARPGPRGCSPKSAACATAAPTARSSANTFQRPRDQALDMLDKIIGIYQNRCRTLVPRQTAQIAKI